MIRDNREPMHHVAGALRIRHIHGEGLLDDALPKHPTRSAHEHAELPLLHTGYRNEGAAPKHLTDAMAQTLASFNERRYHIPNARRRLRRRSSPA